MRQPKKFSEHGSTDKTMTGAADTCQQSISPHRPGDEGTRVYRQPSQNERVL